MDDSTCVLCFEEMDMKVYNDNQESTSTCYKLACGHAYHTKCIIDCLQKTDHQCPQCNKHKTPGQALTLEGLAFQLTGELRKTKEVREYLQESKLAKKDYMDCMKQLKNDIRTYAKNRSKELLFTEKRKNFSKFLGNSKRVLKQAASSKKDPRYAGAIESIPLHKLYEKLHNLRRHRVWRLREPYFSMMLR